MKALMDVLFYDETPAYEGVECEIRLGDGEIVVTYWEEDGVVLYRGREDGEGHYILECPAKNGKASLHSFPDSRYLEGWWIEEGYRGAWRVTLLKQKKRSNNRLPLSISSSPLFIKMLFGRA